MKNHNLLLALLTSTITLTLTGCGQGSERVNAPSQEQTGGTQQEVGSESKSAGEVYVGTISGVISDSMCGLDHSGMIKSGHGTDAVTCTQKCLQEGNRLVFCDPKTKTIYKLAEVATAKNFAGNSVSLTGHIDTSTKTIHVHSIKAQ